jgi:hypothetical protein
MRGRLLKVLPLGVAFIGLGCILLTGGCSSGSARFRYVLGSTGAPGTSVDVDVDGKTVLNGISYGAAGTYKSSSSGSRQFEVFQTGTTTNPFFNGSVSLSSGDTTVISVNTFSTMAMTAFTDDNAAPTSGNVKLRFIHASPTAGGVDVYVIQPPNTIGGLSPQLTVQYKEASGYLSLTAGTYEVVMTQAGTQNPISGLDNTFSLTAGQVRTIVILDGPSGGGPYRQVILSDLN